LLLYYSVTTYNAMTVHCCAYNTVSEYVPESTLNIHTPGIPTLLVCAILTMLGVCDPVIVIELTPSPALIPARASLPPNPLLPVVSPVVHCILPKAYRNITNDSAPLVASTHWNVLVYSTMIEDSMYVMVLCKINPIQNS